MNQRLIAAYAAVPLVLGLLIAAAVLPLPYVAYSPGSTVDVLGETDDEAEIIQVLGAETYRDDGQLRMTTVRLTQPGDRLSLLGLTATWLDPDDAVYPYAAIYDEDETAENNKAEGAVQMSTSQDYAIEVALSEMGIEVPQVLQVADVTEGQPSEGVLEVGDRLRTVDGVDVTTDTDLRDEIAAGDPGGAIELGIERAGEERTVEVTPVESEGRRLIGITPGYGFDFPFEVDVNIPATIGGPSAGLMFSLAIYDTLTPGSLTGGRDVAGTGEIAPDGTVGSIGGIQQKVAGARDEGVDLFLVPSDNCADALTADNGDMRLVRAVTMHDARLALEDYAADPDADLPSCEDPP